MRLTLAIVLSCALSLPALAVPTFQIATVGFTDQEHTRDDGYQFSFFNGYNAAGQVIGGSERYNGGPDALGSSAWFYDGANTINIGLTGPEYTTSLGWRSSDAFELNEAGQVHGLSQRVDDSDVIIGYQAWLFDGANTVEIGLMDNEHIGGNNERSSVGSKLNQAGQVLGYSQRFQGGAADLGTSVWLYSGGTSTKIGLVGPDHTRDDGYLRSDQYTLNEAGQAVGNSTLFYGGPSE